MKHSITILTALLLVVLPALHAAASAETGDVISIAGTWRFLRDDGAVGGEQKWFAGPLAGAAVIPLPGSTDEAKLGVPNPEPPPPAVKTWDSKLYRPNVFVGSAWYQREVLIPEAWRGKRIALFLERAHWATEAWLDDRPLGAHDSLCVPHRYELGTGVTPGRHRLTVRVDNRLKYNLGLQPHSVSEETQTDWNGLIGRLELRATAPVWLADVQVYPNTDRKTARVVVTIGNATGQAGRGTLRVDRQSIEATWTADGGRAELEVPLNEAKLWDEFASNLSSVIVQLGDEQRTVSFGLRQFAARSTGQFELNGRPTFLRGTLECCVFPRTGYPAMDVSAWARIFRIARDYGLNHMRFHSWCPPEAAFVAADAAGMLLQVEAPQWVNDIGKDQPRDEFIRQEMLRILAEYGNHPSFMMFSLGNELVSVPRRDFTVLNAMITLAKKTDPRHLYTAQSNPEANGCYVPQATDDYLVLHDNQINNVRVWRRGQKLFETDTPGTAADYRDTLTGLQVPVVSHEVGQWSSYPNLDEISKYTGVLRPTAFEMARDDLARRGLLDRAPAWTQASGRFAALLYREEIERSLRTPNYGGFQLLDLRDFPGQWCAVVGILDAFWDSKGFITPEAWRRFCGPVVPLLRMDKRVWTTAESFRARAEIANYGPANLVRALPEWTLQDEAGHVLARGEWPAHDLPTGGLTSLGEISLPLEKIKAPARLTVAVGVRGTTLSNDWPVWVYPATVDTAPPPAVTVATAWDNATRAALAEGKAVLLLASQASLFHSSAGQFTPKFWGSGVGGIACDPQHPALAKFPTDSFSNWQWHELMTTSQKMLLDSLPSSYRPIVEVVDSGRTGNKRWALLLEARVGQGRLLVSSVDLQTDLAMRPVALQLLRSLLDYAASDAFQPPASLTEQQVDTFLRRLRVPPDGGASSVGKPAGTSGSTTIVSAVKTVTTHETEARLYVDGQGWRIDQAKITDPKRPRVLFIGDSILNGYLPLVTQALAGKVYVDAWVNSYCLSSDRLFDMLGEVIDRGQYDVIHFNLGIHGWQKGRIPAGQFEPLTKAYLGVLQSRAAQAKLIWASSTPVTVKGKPGVLNPEINPIIVEQNRMAASVMQQMNVPVNDLYALLAGKLDLARGDQFHWTPPAYQILADAITKSILQDLKPKQDLKSKEKP